jgi:serine dehydrogenase proteinase
MPSIVKLLDLKPRAQISDEIPITVEAAKAMGLPVSTDMPPQVYELMDLYPQAGEGRPSVMYVPLKRQPATGTRNRHDSP